MVKKEVDVAQRVCLFKEVALEGPLKDQYGDFRQGVPERTLTAFPSPCPLPFHPHLGAREG